MGERESEGVNARPSNMRSWGEGGSKMVGRCGMGDHRGGLTEPPPPYARTQQELQKVAGAPKIKFPENQKLFLRLENQFGQTKKLTKRSGRSSRVLAYGSRKPVERPL